MHIKLFIFLLLSVFSLVQAPLRASETSIVFTAEEQAWLNQHPKIKLSSDINQAPFAMIDNAGKPIGIQQDIFNHISELIGQEIILFPSSEPHSFELIAQPSLYGIASLIKTPKSESLYVFTDSYMDTSLYIYCHKNNDDKINNLADLSGLKVVVLRDNYSQLAYLDNIPNVAIMFVDSPLEQLQKVLSHEADALIGYSNYPYIISEYLMNDISLAYIAISKIELHIALKPEHKVLSGILNKVIAKLDDQALHKIFQKWREQSLDIESLMLTNSEKTYLNNHLFKRATSKNWIPFNYTSDQKVVGISEDFWKLIASKLPIKTEPLAPTDFAEILTGMESRQVDLYPATSYAIDRDYALFSEPYEHYPIAIATRNETGYIADSSVLNGQVVAVGKNFSSYYLMKEKYPDINFLQVNNTEEALQQVIDNKAFAAIDALPVLQYHIEHVIFGKAKLSGITDVLFPLQIMVHKDNAQLLTLINRAIAAIKPEERHAIQRKWMRTDVITTTDYTLVWEISAASLVLIIITLMWNRTLRKQITLRKEAEEKYHRISVTDPLTGVYNRLKLDEVFSYELNRAVRYQKPFSIILIDLDKFKRVNDEFGHLAGDTVLKEFTQVALKNLRSTDTFGRWGGEEFLIISPDSSVSSAAKFAEKLRLAINSHEFSAIKNLTASYGVSSFEQQDNQASMLGRADKALYHAKANGRDQVVVFPLKNKE